MLDAKDTDTALRLLGSHAVTLAITNMHRPLEGSPKGDPAGLHFLRAASEMRAAGSTTPELVVYCSRNSAERYRQLALGAGATLVTASPTDLLVKLRALFGQL